jgi:hypothetical protein
VILSRCLRPLSLTRIASIGTADRKASSTSRMPSIPAQPPECSARPARAARKRCSQRFSRPDMAVGCREGWAGEEARGTSRSVTNRLRPVKRVRSVRPDAESRRLAPVKPLW